MTNIPIPLGLPRKYHELYRKAKRAETPDWIQVDKILEELASTTLCLRGAKIIIDPKPPKHAVRKYGRD